MIQVTNSMTANIFKWLAVKQSAIFVLFYPTALLKSA